jgi:hypothetical protein
MPKGPQGQKRPADAVANAVMVARIATGEINEVAGMPLKESRASGGLVRSQRLSPTRRSEIAKLAASARWKEKEGVK